MQDGRGIAVSFPTYPNLLTNELVFEFMWKFSAFECAMKRLDCYSPRDKDGPVSANWDLYAKRLKEIQAVCPPTFLEAAHALVKLAPKQQTVTNGRLGWSPVARGAGESYARFALRLVCTVRNNLFHGGKYPDGHALDVARNKALLTAALAVLTECYELDTELQHWIYEVAQAA
jgi:hypothetical protein